VYDQPISPDCAAVVEAWVTDAPSAIAARTDVHNPRHGCAPMPSGGSSQVPWLIRSTAPIESSAARPSRAHPAVAVISSVASARTTARLAAVTGSSLARIVPFARHPSDQRR
jgi:hypothetical protein